jgi:hypothetical protein
LRKRGGEGIFQKVENRYGGYDWKKSKTNLLNKVFEILSRLLNVKVLKRKNVALKVRKMPKNQTYRSDKMHLKEVI